ncbi:MAG: asparaginase [Mesorhizobium sp.]|nr:N(4)-(beta-N-acetylglucosaminyl)-L-asparaginase [Mesorhizobium sp.]RWK55964.1 MAG: asparaginase [Mesorhizobium sp.]RWM39436.1 MAG: asparaginase [Mesorhizobium sp.]RWM49166.1 MAG: asparaginase [Mesorhizobium sp.]RWO23212.1 MAG: asparaginase [Mesorhizobium sp.]TIM81454.1 MAG: asparaginase [Mesorhizobium sp.]
MIVISNRAGASGIAETARLFSQRGTVLDAIEAGIRLVEADENVRSVGCGGWPNLLGEVQLDASIMDGRTLRAGAIGALTGYLHPITIARALMEKLPHVFLVDQGAARFANEIGAEAGENVIPDTQAVWEKWFRQELTDKEKALWPNAPLTELCKHAIDPEISKDTTVFIGQDSVGDVAAGTSTSGWGWKYPGRLGDSPVIGAGSYADNRYGACACTGMGEMTIRSGTARSVVLYMKKGATVEDAVYEAVEDMRALDGGVIGCVIIHAIDNRGRSKVVSVNGEADDHYWMWKEGYPAPVKELAEVIQISSVPVKKTVMDTYGEGRR